MAKAKSSSSKKKASSSQGKTSTATSAPPKEILRNKRALRDYHVEEKYEAGLVLKGTEVKSLRNGKANFVDSYAEIKHGEAWLYGLDIQPYEHASHENHEPRARRKLLLHQREIEELADHANRKGNTLVALKLYWKNGKVKAEIAAARGKAAPDKREDLKAKVAKRETDRAMANFNRGRG